MQPNYDSLSGFLPIARINVLLAIGLLFFLFSEGTAQGGYTLDFDGTDGHVVMSGSPSYTTNMTFEAWIKNHANPNVDIIVGMDGTVSNHILEFRIYNKKLELLTNDGTFGTVTGTTNMDDNQWHHVAFVKQGTAGTLYVDGKIEATGTVLASLTLDHMVIGNLYLNGSPFGGDYEFDGYIDEVRIWDDARTQAEIQANMHRELEGSEANLVAYYQMSDGSGTTLTDNSTNTHTGTLTNGPVWKTSGALAGPGQALDFDGSNDYVTLGDQSSLENLSTVSIEVWIKPTTITTGYSQIVNKDRVYFLAIYQNGSGDNKITTSFENGVDYSQPNLESVSNISAGEWTHIAVTRNSGGLMKLYINGVLDNSFTNTTVSANSSSVRFGASSIGTQFFNGIIDEVRFWSDERTEAEIRDYKDRALDGNEANLLAYYRFDQQAASGHTTVYDYSGNGLDGTLTNMDATTDWISSAPFNTWIGSEDSDWNNADNWSRGAVPSTEDLGIFAWSGSNAPASSNISGRNFYVASGVSLSHSGNLTLSGNFFNAGTFLTTGTVTFSGSSAQKLSGSGSTTIGTLTLNNASGLSLEKDVTVSTDLSLTNGALSIGANTLTINGSITTSSGSLTGGSSSNITLGGSGASTSLQAVTLNNLTLNRANGISLSGTVSVGGTLTLTNGVLDLNSQTLSIGNSGSISGTPSSANHINATSGTLRKNLATASSFNFPVGDGTNYSPLSLNFSSGSFTSAYADVTVTASKHPSNSSTTDYLNRYWTVTSSGISSFSCDVTATFVNGDIAGTETNMDVGKWNGSAWSNLGAVNAAANQLSGTVTSFSDFTGGETPVFPVEWLSFTARPENSYTLLSWETASERNTNFFGIEWSKENQNWDEIGRVEAVGNSDIRMDYSFVDYQYRPGTVYYRLKQVDMDGAFSYSKVIEVERESLVQVYPNPVYGILHLSLPEGKWEGELLDIQGRRLVIYGQIGEMIDMSEFSTGIYILKLKDMDGQIFNISVVKK